MIHAPAPAQSARLVEWPEPASLVPLLGPGEPMYRLPALVRWQRGANRDERNYLIEVRLPDGSVRLSPLTPHERPGSTTLTVLVPASAVRNLVPSAVRLTATIVDSTGAVRVSNSLEATIADFPTPLDDAAAEDHGPFGYGRPLDPADPIARTLRTSEPDGIEFIALPGGSADATTYIARNEASNRQVALRLPGYDPRAGRSDEFVLEDPAQPALGLSPSRADGYLAALTTAVGDGVTFRLPTVDEWNRAALAGSSAKYWWGDDPIHSAGANLLGPEPGVSGDVTARVEGSDALDPNPLHLVNTFGNVAEWAVDAEGGHQRMGGHFRTDPADGLDPVPVASGDEVGPDAYVGLRPAFTLTATDAVALIRSRLRSDPRLGDVEAAFEPARATAVLTGRVGDAAARHAADERIRPLWFVAAVENRLETPSVEPGRLARLAGVSGQVSRRRVIDRFEAIFPVRVLWAGELPVEGSEWWVNVESPGAGWSSYRLPMRHVGEPLIPIIVPAANLRGPVAGVAGLSLGGPAQGPLDPRWMSDAIPLRSDVP